MPSLRALIECRWRTRVIGEIDGLHSGMAFKYISST